MQNALLFFYYAQFANGLPLTNGPCVSVPPRPINIWLLPLAALPAPAPVPVPVPAAASVMTAMAAVLSRGFSPVRLTVPLPFENCQSKNQLSATLAAQD